MTLLLVLVSLLAGSAPHIVLVLADDFGWHNAGFHPDSVPSDEIQTTNLNQLAKEGVVLDRHYSYKICSPSRCSIQTGRLPVHVNVVNTAPEVFNRHDVVSGFAGIPRNMTGIATRLQEAGYRTHMSGKWDVGMATYEHTPLGRGYQSWIGYYHHANSYWNYGLPFESTGEVNICLNQFTDLSENNTAGKRFVTNPATYEEEWFLERSREVIMAHDTSRPLFLFHSFHIVHTPLQIPTEYLSRFDFINYENRKKYAAMVYYMDQVIGQLVEALKMKSMWENTLLVFFSDNGGPVYSPGSSNNFPLKGGKYSDFEGGIRVNALASGGWIPSNRRGTVSKDLIHISDWYATFLDIAGLDIADKQAEKAGLPLVDGISQRDVLLGSKHNLRTSIHVSEECLIEGHMKLVMGSQPMCMWQGPTYPNATGVQPTFLPKGMVCNDCVDGCLFDIFADPTEHHDLAIEKSATLEAMKARLGKLNENNFNPNRGHPDIRACIQAIKNHGFYGPFLSEKDLMANRMEVL